MGGFQQAMKAIFGWRSRALKVVPVLALVASASLYGAAPEHPPAKSYFDARTLQQRLVRGVAAGFAQGIKKLAFEKYDGVVSDEPQGPMFGAKHSYRLTPRDSQMHPVVFHENLVLASFDGTKLSANLLLPKLEDPQTPLPVLIFISSWVLDKHEYLQRAITFAERGYVVLAYSTRGFAMSEGMVGVGDANDMQDVSAMIDWLQANSPLPTGKIGLTGISYGALISLLAAAHEPRVEAIAALSGASSLLESLFGGETPSTFWSAFLLGSGELLGRFDPVVKHHFNELLHGRQTPAAMAWAKARSPIELVDRINANHTKVYMAHGWLDYLFKPETMFALYDKLTVAKKLTLHDGIHFLTEMLGAGDPKDAGWHEIHDWFDYFLVGDHTSWYEDKPIHVKVRHNGDEREHWAEWEPSESERMQLFLSPQKNGRYYKLVDEPNAQPGSTQIQSSWSDSATTGVPMLSSILDAYFDHQIKKDFTRINLRHAHVQLSEAIPHQMGVRGAAQVKLQLTASAPQLQVVAYLYDVSDAGIGTLISHGVVTRWQQAVGKEMSLEIPMVSTAYNMPAGHRLGLVIDTVDPLYVLPIQGSYRLRFDFGEHNQSHLSVPFIVRQAE